MIMVNDDDFESVVEMFQEAFLTHTSTSPNQQILASLDVARRQMELEGYELTLRATALSLKLRREINGHPLISKYFKILTPADLIPADLHKTGTSADYGPAEFDLEGSAGRMGQRRICARPDAIDPDVRHRRLRRHAVQGPAGRAVRHPAQQNVAQLDPVDDEISTTPAAMWPISSRCWRSISSGIWTENRLGDGKSEAAQEFKARVKSLVEDVPDLPNFSRFHDTFRANPKSKDLHPRSDMRAGFYMAYDAANCEHLKLNGKEIDERVSNTGRNSSRRTS